jgi:hypothetical protein
MQLVRPGTQPGRQAQYTPMRINMQIKESSMTKAQDNKKETKKEPAKTMKEKKEAKKVKKEERARH